MKVVTTNDSLPQSGMGVAMARGTSLLREQISLGQKQCSLVTWMLIPPQTPHGKLMDYLHIFKC